MSQAPESPSPAADRHSIHPEARLDRVHLKVADLERALDFYQRQIGLELMDHKPGSASLGAGGTAFLHLDEIPTAQRPPPSATGLYHFAILFPDRRSLAIKIAQLVQQGFSVGQGDHWVSEAFYLSDPDGNGLELYRDRPRSQWKHTGGQVLMGTDPVDIEGFFAEIQAEDPAEMSFQAPAETRLGHIHLRVADLEASQHFYCDLLGMDLQARLPGALFVSAGGYHHHIGMNIWQSRSGRPPAEPSSGLREFGILLPAAEELMRLTGRFEAAGIPPEREMHSIVVHDPASIRVRLTAAD